jgi:hypothetical protein
MVMGVRSLLVLMKLGYDLRSEYEHLMDDPVPEHLQPFIERLPSRWHDIIDLRAHTAAAAELRP